MSELMPDTVAVMAALFSASSWRELLIRFCCSTPTMFSSRIPRSSSRMSSFSSEASFLRSFSTISSGESSSLGFSSGRVTVCAVFSSG